MLNFVCEKYFGLLYMKDIANWQNVVQQYTAMDIFAGKIMIMPLKY